MNLFLELKYYRDYYYNRIYKEQISLDRLIAREV